MPPKKFKFPLSLSGRRLMSSSDCSLGKDNLRRRLIRIVGDGRCLFRSVAYGACLRAGKPSPSETLQKELADDLRSKVVDEFVRRRSDTEWLVASSQSIY
ncbi:OTU domain-containing protein [Acorus calamus]|uniref:OTU domain-containing protein n=1 Tax=Acorus calamus TaxID=4465 RepID=A0AAV9CMA3_ACOCL|nr:OTU domain-containing protein [Acorus calamus]